MFSWKLTIFESLFGEKDTASGMANGSATMSAGRHFNVRLNRKLDAGDAGFLPLHLRICDSPSSGANCREKRLQVLVDAPEAGRRTASVNAGALTAVMLIIVLGISEFFQRPDGKLWQAYLLGVE